MAKAVVTERCEMRKRDREVHRFDDDETLDGETIRTPMVLMDSMAGYRRGYVQIGEADGCVVVSEAYAMKQ